MPKRGNWGDWAIIDLPPLEIKKASCYACINYIQEDGSCSKTPIIPKKDGKNNWRKCKYFKLSPEFMNYSFKQQVINVKGRDFFEEKITVEEIKIDAVQKENQGIDANIIKEKILCEDTRKMPHKIQFNVKSAKHFRAMLAKYYCARTFDGAKVRSVLLERGYTEEVAKKGIQLAKETAEKRIKNAVEMVPEKLAEAFVSVNTSEFPIELAIFFYMNGLDKATNLNCQPYCDAIRAFALDYLIGTQKHLGDINVDINTKRKMLFLDALSTIFTDARIIASSKYQITEDYIIKKINNI